MKVQVSEEYSELIFANGVQKTLIVSTDNYKALQLDVNCGISGSFLNPSSEQEELKQLLISAAPVSVDNNVRISSSDGMTTYFTIDCAELIPSGWLLKVERLNLRHPRSLGVVIYHPDHADEAERVKVFTNDDFREVHEDRCSAISGTSYFNKETVRCAREDEHIGGHQALNSTGDYYDWPEDNQPPSIHPTGKFGLKVVCPHCGLVDAGDATGVKTCSTCSYWLDQAKSRAGAFVVDGVHYRAGRGGFGGRIWNLIRKDGTKWSGELWYQGEVPSQFRELFPDNATMDETKLDIKR